jgi:hypothetical protein
MLIFRNCVIKHSLQLFLQVEGIISLGELHYIHIGIFFILAKFENTVVYSVNNYCLYTLYIMRM